MKNAGELRSGSTFKKDNNLYLVLKAEKFKSTAGRRASAVQMKFKLKDLITGNVSMLDIEASEKLDDIRLDRNKMQFLYESDGDYYFMDQETFEQISLRKDDLEEAVYFLEEEMIIDVLSYEERPVGVELPTTVDREVTYTELQNQPLFRAVMSYKYLCLSKWVKK